MNKREEYFVTLGRRHPLYLYWTIDRVYKLGNHFSLILSTFGILRKIKKKCKCCNFCCPYLMNMTTSSLNFATQTVIIWFSFRVWQQTAPWPAEASPGSTWNLGRPSSNFVRWNVANYHFLRCKMVVDWAGLDHQKYPPMTPYGVHICYIEFSDKDYL